VQVTLDIFDLIVLFAEGKAPSAHGARIMVAVVKMILVLQVLSASSWVDSINLETTCADSSITSGASLLQIVLSLRVCFALVSCRLSRKASASA